MDERKLKEILLRESPDFRQAHDEHQACERELKKLVGKAFPDEADVQAEKEIKKRKLALKDRMYRLMQERAGRP